jgi:hypothetical protein
MKQRCLDPGCKSYARYGGRGIAVCARWLNGEDGLSGFQCFLADMGERPHGLTLDRKDNRLGYSPSNCRWAGIAEQARNRRDSVFVRVKGRRVHLKVACAERGLPYSAVWQRINRLGWPVQRSLSQPLRSH